MKKWSMWTPLSFYGDSGNLFLIMARKNLKSGMIQFKVKRVNRFFTMAYAAPALDIAKQFEIVSGAQQLLQPDQ